MQRRACIGLDCADVPLSLSLSHSLTLSLSLLHTAQRNDSYHMLKAYRHSIHCIISILLP